MEDKLITIATTTYSRAILIQSMLESEKIECYLSNINMVQPLISTEVKVKVSPDDVDKAMPLAEASLKEFGSAKEKAVAQLKAIRRILVPIDFSEYSLKGIEHALGLAVKFKAEIMLFHAFYNPPVNEASFDSTIVYQTTIDSFVHEMEANAIKRIKEIVADTKKRIKEKALKGIRVNYEVMQGPAADSILFMCDDYKPAIIIMGTRGKGQKRDELLGSTTLKVMRDAKIPVLVIPEDVIFKGFDKTQHVMYATDFDKSDFRAIRRLMALIRPFDVKIHVVHLDCGDSNPMDKFRMESLQKHFAGEYPEFNVAFDIIQCEDILEGIQEYVEQKQIDIISLATRKRNILLRWLNPGLAKKVFFQTHNPLLVFHTV